jgi:FtsP/CotA-like multicopper oxidase with cupredoxin domain
MGMRPSSWTNFVRGITRPVSRRTLIQGSAGGAAMTALAAHGQIDDAGVAADDSPAAAPRQHDITLTASEFDHELMPGVVVRAWGYNGTMPGPELRVTEGDTVRVTLRNELPVPTTIHWHGLNVPNAMDGVAGLNQAPVEPGQEFVYEFVATPAGTRWYHSHTDPASRSRWGSTAPSSSSRASPPRPTTGSTPWSWPSGTSS